MFQHVDSTTDLNTLVFAEKPSEIPVIRVSSSGSKLEAIVESPKQRRNKRYFPRHESSASSSRPPMSEQQAMRILRRRKILDFHPVYQFSPPHKDAIIRHTAVELWSTQQYARLSRKKPVTPSKGQVTPSFVIALASLGLLAALIAAVRIQSAYRGHRLRLQLKGQSFSKYARVPYEAKFAWFLKRFNLPVGPGALVLYAVVRCQSWWRMISTRRSYRRQRLLSAPGSVPLACLIKIQKFVRKWLTRTAKKRKRPEPAAIIQRAWRRCSEKIAFRYFRDLLAFRNSGDPVKMLKSIIPTETELLDPAIKARVRFRLGVRPEASEVPQLSGAMIGTIDLFWPPTIYYKIFTSAPTCDVNSFAPRNYNVEQQVSEVLKQPGMPHFDASVTRVQNAGIRVGKTVFAARVSDALTPGSSARPGIPPRGDLSTKIVLFNTSSMQLELSAPPTLTAHQAIALQHEAKTLSNFRNSVAAMSPSKAVSFGSTTAKLPELANFNGTKMPDAFSRETVSRLASRAATRQALGHAVQSTTSGRVEAKPWLGGRLPEIPVSRQGRVTPTLTKAVPRSPIVLQSADEVTPNMWYKRVDSELNKWRPVSLALVRDADIDPALRLKRELAAKYQSPSAAEAPSMRVKQIQAKRARRKWLMSLYHNNLAHETIPHHTTPALSSQADATGVDGASSIASIDDVGTVNSGSTDYFPNLELPVEFSAEEMGALLAHRHTTNIYSNYAARMAAQAPRPEPAPVDLRFAPSVDFERYCKEWKGLATSQHVAH